MKRQYFFFLIFESYPLVVLKYFFLFYVSLCDVFVVFSDCILVAYRFEAAVCKMVNAVRN